MKLHYYQITDAGEVKQTYSPLAGVNVLASNKTEATKLFLQRAAMALSNPPELYVKEGAFALVYPAQGETGGFCVDTGRLDRVEPSGRVSAICGAFAKTPLEAKTLAQNNYYASAQYAECMG